MIGASLFDRTWDIAVQLCRGGSVRGERFVAGVSPLPVGDSPEKVPQFAVTSPDGGLVFQAPTEETADYAALFAVARRFIELEDASRHAVPAPEYVVEPRRTYRESLREWGLMDENGKVLKAYEYDPEPLLGYVVRVGEPAQEYYAYGVVKQSALSEGTITPTGVCATAEEAKQRSSELLRLALLRGATVMGMNGVPAVIDLTAEPDDDNS